MAPAPQPGTSGTSGPTGTAGPTGVPGAPGSDQRRAHLAELRRAEQARQRRNRLVGIAASVAVVAALTVGGVLFVHAQTAQSENGGATGTAAEAKSAPDGKNGTAGRDDKAGGAGHFTTGSDGVRTWQGALTRNHTTAAVTYPMEPPVGGDHNPVWQNCNGDVYSRPVRNEHAVHALEHGAVWVTYNARAAKADVAALAEKVRRTPYTLMSPVADQKDPIMLSAWAHQRTVTGAGDPNVDTFLAEFVQGSQTPEPGAACTGGVDR